MPRREGCLDRDAFASLVGLGDSDPIGFYGVTPVVRATIAANGTDAATTQTLANDLKAKLISLGLVKA